MKPGPLELPAEPFVFVVATRLDEAGFLRHTRLGRCLPLISTRGRLPVRAAFVNSQGLPSVYNRVLDAAKPDEVLVFVHDDVRIDDIWWRLHLGEALQHFDVIGVAGNQRVPPAHMAWWGGYGPDGTPWRDEAWWSGGVREEHPGFDGGPVRDQVHLLGPAPCASRLLDGLLLVARAGVLREAGVRFDERFDFHFYDLDFCRSAHAAGLRIGTWPLAVTHSPGGAFGSEAWQQGLVRYRAKWPVDA